MRSQLQSSGRKVQTLRRITQEIVLTQQPITAQQPGRDMTVGSVRCLTDTKIQANSSVETPDLTTKMPGMNSLLKNHDLPYTFEA